eukprot:GEZU01015778.1.p1 GENE.GEZU01015778.1~~GEZU01015778.1.p1  ORF type:complete len:130 (-),score=12.70 GEZU01015778.1:70-459(-)
MHACIHISPAFPPTAIPCLYTHTRARARHTTPYHHHLTSYIYFLKSFLAMANTRSDNKAPVNIVQAAYGACVLLKACARSAFQKHGRGVTTPDIIKEIGPVFMSIYGDEEGEDKRTSCWLNSKLCNNNE